MENYKKRKKITAVRTNLHITANNLGLNKFVGVLLPFKEAMHQVEENIVTCFCICFFVVGLMKTLEQLKNSTFTRLLKANFSIFFNQADLP